MIRLVPCGVRECKQARIDGEERNRERHHKQRKEKHRWTEYVPPAA
jgi:hypothetical protein